MHSISARFPNSCLLKPFHKGDPFLKSAVYSSKFEHRLVHTLHNQAPQRLTNESSSGTVDTQSMKANSRSLAEARPSASVIIVSPKNDVLLIHRVKSSTSFASAHVFPGGNLSEQDGAISPVGTVERHLDNQTYRKAALREVFEESGILLAKQSSKSCSPLLEMSSEALSDGRRAIHAGEVLFDDWLTSKKLVADTAGLLPFTHWITPTNVLKRFTTQMFLYFLPLEQKVPDLEHGRSALTSTPTSDGGLEVIATEFLPAKAWLEKAKSGEIMLYPPQYLLLYLIAREFDSVETRASDFLSAQRERLLFLLEQGSPPWKDKYISPRMRGNRHADGRLVLDLDRPGFELEETEHKGEKNLLMLANFGKDGVRNVEVITREAISRSLLSKI